MFAALLLPVVLIVVLLAIRYGGAVFNRRPGQRPLTASEAALQTNLRWAAGIILAAGLLAAAIVYQNASADEAAAGAIGYEIDGGTQAPIMPGDSKSYDQQMEGIGGKATVLGDEIAGLWHGRNLAYTLAVLAVGGALLCFVFAQLQGQVPPREE
jgi:hypothetical protein